MNKTSIALFSFLSAMLLFGGIFSYAHAQVVQDEAVDPAALGVGAPKVLPGNPLYFFKNLSRGIRSVVTFGDKKAELKLQFASEKIVEAQLLVDRGNRIRAAKHLKSYEKDLARARHIANKEKFIVQSIRHQATIDMIEKEASEEQAADIKNIREKTIKHISEVVASIEDVEIAKNMLILATSDEGSVFKPLRNLEVLKAVEEKVPERAKKALRAAQENAVKRFKRKYEKSTEEDKDALRKYIKSAGGNASRYMEAFNENKEVLGEELLEKILSDTPPRPVRQKKVSPKPAPKSRDAVQKKPVTKSAKPVTKPANTDTQTKDLSEPAVEKKDTTKTEIKKEKTKPYMGSPPLLY